MKNSVKLKQLVADPSLLMVPGVYDGITAQLVRNSDFKAGYVTGAGVSMSVVGLPDLNIVSYTEARDRVHTVTSVLNDKPVIVDVDTGYGGPLNILRMVQDFTMMGVAAVQIEDQMMPKRCGHVLGRRTVSCEEMCRRIEVIAETRGEDGMLIVARTDSLTKHGIDEAIRRGNAFLEHGADIVFIESPEKLDDIKRIGQEIKGYKLFNNVEGGRSPFLTHEQLEQLGFNIAIYPNSIARSMIPAGLNMLKTLYHEGTTEPLWPNMMRHPDMFALFGFNELVEWESNFKTEE